MYPSSNIASIQEEFQRRQDARRRKLAKIWGAALAGVILVSIVLIVSFPDMFEDGATAWILPLYGGVGFVGTLIGLLVSLNFQSIKPFFIYLYPEIYKDINIDQELYLQYEAFPKDKVEFNKNGGVFTRFASVKIRRHVSGDSSDGIPFDIYDCTMTTSNGKSSQTHFDGIYFVVRKSHGETLQVRTTGRPALKGIKFEHHKDITGIKVYKPEEQELMSVDMKYVDYVRMMAAQEQFKHVYLGLIPGEIHFALWYRDHPARKLATVDAQTLDGVRRQFLAELQIIEDLHQIDGGY